MSELDELERRAAARQTHTLIQGRGERLVAGQLHDIVVEDRYTLFNLDAFGGNGVPLFVRNLNALDVDLQIVSRDDYIQAYPDIIRPGAFTSEPQPRPAYPEDERYRDQRAEHLYPKGTMLVLVHKPIFAAVRQRVERYVLDVGRDGYWAEIIVTDGGTEADVRDLVRARSPRGVLLVGAIVAPWYNHKGSRFPCDFYYMETSAAWSRSNGELTGSSGGLQPELWAGRLTTPTKDGDDADMINEYFDRNHRFRQGGAGHRRSGVALVDDDWAGFPHVTAKRWSGWPGSFAAGIDAAITFPGGKKAYFFHGDAYIRYDISTKKVDPGYPRKISAAWTGLPASFQQGIDAAVLWPSGKVYFFKGSQYVRYDPSTGRTDPGYPADIGSRWSISGSFAADIDAVVAFPGGKKAYFFRGDEYIRYDIASSKVDPRYPRQIRSAWRKMPGSYQQGVDASVLWPDGTVHFFRKNTYQPYSTARDEAIGVGGFGDCALSEMLPSADVVTITERDDTTAARYQAELDEPYSWVQVCVHSNLTLHAFGTTNGSGGTIRSRDLSTINPPDAHFYNLFACIPGRYTEPDYLAGWYIFDQEGGEQCQGLTAIASTKSGSMLHFKDFYRPLGRGREIGEAYQDWWSSRGSSHSDGVRSWHYGMVLLGDPTLSWWKGAVPEPLAPTGGAAFDHFPRTMTLEWSPVTLRGVTYEVEVDALGAIKAGEWAEASGQTFLRTVGLTATHYSLSFVGAQRGRWRVRAVVDGQTCSWSAWAYFSFTV